MDTVPRELYPEFLLLSEESFYCNKTRGEASGNESTERRVQSLHDCTKIHYLWMIFILSGIFAPPIQRDTILCRVAACKAIIVWAQ